MHEKERFLNITLTEELEKFVRFQVETGLYSSPSEVIREALRLLYRQYVDYEVGLSLKQREQGQIVSGEESYRKMQQLMAQYEPKSNASELGGLS